MESETPNEQNIGLKVENNILQLGMLMIFLWDSLGAVASRMLEFDYTNIGAGTILIYLAAGFITARKKSVKKAVKYTAIMGLFESTVCWVIVIMLEPNTVGKSYQPYSVVLWIFVVIAVICTTALIGLIGAGIAMATKRKIPVMENFS